MQPHTNYFSFDFRAVGPNTCPMGTADALLCGNAALQRDGLLPGRAAVVRRRMPAHHNGVVGLGRDEKVQRHRTAPVHHIEVVTTVFRRVA